MYTAALNDSMPDTLGVTHCVTHEVCVAGDAELDRFDPLQRLGVENVDARVLPASMTTLTK